MQEAQKPEVHEWGPIARGRFRSSIPIAPRNVRDVQEEEDGRQGRVEVRSEAGAAVRPQQREEDEGRNYAVAVASQRRRGLHSQMLQLLAPAVRGAELPDVLGLQESRVYEWGELQRADLGAEFDAHAADVGGRPVLPAREMPEAVVVALQEVEDEGGLFERAAAVQQSARTPPEAHRLLPPAARCPEVQDVLSLPRRGVQWEEEELQRLRSSAHSETDAEVVG